MTDNNLERKMIVGNLELCDLPELGIHNLEVRVDTGAKTSSLHVDNIIEFKKDGQTWLKFDIHHDVHQVDKIVACECPLHSVRKIKSSNAMSEKRYVIKTLIALSTDSWPIEITLTDRSDMNYLMLLGRQGMQEKVLVDPSQSFVLSAPHSSL